jgi:hypothetical protein
MNQTHVVLVGLVVLAGLGVMAAFRSGARGAYKVARQTQEVTRMGGNLGRALGTTAVIVGIQWAVVTLHLRPARMGCGTGGAGVVRRQRDRPNVLGHRDRARQ